MIFPEKVVPSEPSWRHQRLAQAIIIAAYTAGVYYARGEMEVHIAQTADQILQSAFVLSLTVAALYWLLGCPSSLFLLVGFLRLLGWVIAGEEAYRSLNPFSDPPGRTIVLTSLPLLGAGMLPRWPALQWHITLLIRSVMQALARVKSRVARMYIHWETKQILNRINKPTSQKRGVGKII